MSGEEAAPEPAPGKLDVFTYVTVEHAALYRAIVDVFVEAKLRYRIQLRVDDVMSALRAQRLLVSHDEADVTTYLDQLRKWGNLKRTQDTRDVATLSEFYHRRSLYQLTTRGEEAHRGVVAVERLLASSGGRLSAIMLPAISERLEAILNELGSSDPDAARLYVCLRELHGFSTDLADNARRFMNDLGDALATLTLSDEAFLAYKRAVIMYLEGFIAELNRYQPHVMGAIQAIDSWGVDKMIHLAASADEAPAPDGTRMSPVRELAERWDALRAWFCGTTHAEPEVEHLRAATRDAITRILRLLERLNEKRFLRVNRTADFRRLAEWFAAAASEEDAHALFTVAFGLYSARHFAVPCPDEELGRGRSWWSAAPAEVSLRLRESGRRSNPGRPGAVPDFSSQKQAALAAVREREEQLQRALSRLEGDPVRLSEIGRVARAEFNVLLSLISAALRGSPDADGRRRAMAPSGRHIVILTEPVGGSYAEVQTEDGRWRAPDYTLQVIRREARMSGQLRRAS